MTRETKEILLLCAAILLVALIAVRFAHSQDKPKETPKPPAPLTQQEEIDYREVQVDIVQSDRALNDAVKALKEYEIEQAAVVAYNKVINRIYDSRHITGNDYLLCDGPGAGPQPNPICAGLPLHKLELRPARPQAKPEPVEPKK